MFVPEASERVTEFAGPVRLTHRLGPQRPCAIERHVVFRCPHCLFERGVERAGALRWRCSACGCPVVPAEGLLERSHAELASLVAAQRAHAIAFGCTCAAWVLGGAAAMAAALGVLLRHAAGVAAGVVALVAAALAVLAAMSARRAWQRALEAKTRLDEAWQQVAAELARPREGSPPPTVSRLEPDRAANG